MESYYQLQLAAYFRIVHSFIYSFFICCIIDSSSFYVVLPIGGSTADCKFVSLNNDSAVCVYMCVPTKVQKRQSMATPHTPT